MLRIRIALAALSAFAACDVREAPGDAGGEERDASSLADVSGSPDVEPATDAGIAPERALDATTADGPPALGACLDTADQALLHSRDMRLAIAEDVASCAASCLDAADRTRCTRDCIAAETALTSACAGCQAGLALCGIDRCGGYSGHPAPVSPCLIAQNCYASYYACADAAPSDACLNPDDEPRLDTEQKREAQTAVAAECGLACMWNPDLEQCAASCMADKSELTSGCTECYARLVICSDLWCAYFCGQGITDPLCSYCMMVRDCDVPFVICTGFPWPSS